MSQDAYIGYQNMLTAVTVGIAELGGVCKELNMEEQARDLEKMRHKLQSHTFSVGIMGEFRRGKSTVINALLGQDIVPSDIVPTSATLNYIRWGADKYAQIYFKDGRTQNVSVDDLSHYITKITEESAQMAETVDYAVVHYPCTFCQNGVQIVDTPGLNDDERMDAISEKVIPSLDAIIMVLVPGAPFSKSEAEFVRNKVMTSDLGRILFVVNKIDTVDEDDRDRLLEHIRGKIQSSVLEKMALVYGEDSEEYARTKEKIGDIRIMPISARSALKGKMKNDSRKYQESGYPEFEAMLSKMLTEERGLLELIHPANKIQSVAKEAVRTIDVRRNALRIEAADFKQIKKDAIAAIKASRKQKKEEIKEFKSKGKTLYAELQLDVEEAYQQISEDLQQYVQELPIDSSCLENQESLQSFSDKVSQQINQEIESTMAIQTERMTNAISSRLVEDVSSLKSFAEDLAADMKTVEADIALASTKMVDSGKTGVGGTVVAAAADAAVLMASLSAGTAIPGIGGIIAGWREHGLKGALTGGIFGAGATVAIASLLAGTALGGLPFLLISGVVSSFGGRAITNLLFGKKQRPERVSVTPEDIRANLMNAVDTAVENMRGEKVMEKWLKNACESMYEKVAEDANQEWENELDTMERNLIQTEADMAKNEEEKNRLEEEMAEQAKAIGQIIESLQLVFNKLNAGMSEDGAQTE